MSRFPLGDHHHHLTATYTPPLGSFDRGPHHTIGPRAEIEMPSLSRRDLQRRVPLLVLVVAGWLVACWFLNDNLLPEMRRSQMAAASRPQVVLRQGNILGRRFEERHAGSTRVLEQFLGVPYALSTAGERRFKPALPVPASEREFDASRYGQRCPAGERDFIPMGEDCLNLDIVRPEVMPEGRKVPVVVYIHGGSFNFGVGSGRGIASMVAWSSRPMIGVSFNYRLGAFGFLSSKVAAKEGVLNLGLKDQRLALEWVRGNIGAFGGDEERVTIMGASAGGHSVSFGCFLCLLCFVLPPVSFRSFVFHALSIFIIVKGL